MGSGSLAAMAVFERFYKPNMEKQDAINLVAEAIKAGIFNDLGSGSNVDVTIITKDGAEVLRNYEKPNERSHKEQKYIYPRGSTGKSFQVEIISLML
jgi:20S proteasome subunit beta 2